MPRAKTVLKLGEPTISVVVHRRPHANRFKSGGIYVHVVFSLWRSPPKDVAMKRTERMVERRDGSKEEARAVAAAHAIVRLLATCYQVKRPLKMRRAALICA